MMSANPSKLDKAIKNAVPISSCLKRLLPHERRLYEEGELFNITHHGSSSIWLESPSSVVPPGKLSVFRPMGDKEVLFLIENNQLPSTQPYQAIIQGEPGREYSTKYLTGAKWTDTHPTTVVEFVCPDELIYTLEKMQTKIEDGVMSMGLGDKAGKGLPLFNDSLKNQSTTWRIVKIKRSK
ncbi:hypothetical protein AKO1_015829, partial [Acrasis kona]